MDNRTSHHICFLEFNVQFFDILKRLVLSDFTHLLLNTFFHQGRPKQSFSDDIRPNQLFHECFSQFVTLKGQSDEKDRTLIDITRRSRPKK